MRISRNIAKSTHSSAAFILIRQIFYALFLLNLITDMHLYHFTYSVQTNCIAAIVLWVRLNKYRQYLIR